MRVIIHASLTIFLNPLTRTVAVIQNGKKSRLKIILRAPHIADIGNNAFRNLSHCFLLQSAEIQLIDQRIRQLFLLQEHEHVDREIGDFVYLLDVAAAENVSFFDAEIRLL